MPTICNVPGQWMPNLARIWSTIPEDRGSHMREIVGCDAAGQIEK
jgi:hypothetical protein